MTRYNITIDEVCAIMDEAVANGFEGMFAFHFYNGPLMYIEKKSYRKGL